MEVQNIFQKKLKRKNFFYTLGTGVAGYFVLSSLPFRFFGRRRLKKNVGKDQVKVKINSLAVSRNKIGGDNGRS